MQDYERENYENQRKDTEFVYVEGRQWSDPIRQKREAGGDLCLEFNQLKQFTNQVVNDQRQNRPGVRVHAASGEASDEVAEIEQGLIRGIEYDSNAEAVYDCGYLHSVVGGRGYWRVVAEYDSPTTFDQKLMLKRVPDPMTVYLDPDYQDPDGGDRNWGFVTERVGKADFEKRYPKAEALDFESGDRQWYTDDEHVIVADYYERVCDYRTLVALADGTVGFRDELEAQFDGVGGKLDESMIVRSRETEVYRVDWYTIAGGDQIVEDHVWPGTIVPIVCAMGDEIMVDGKRVFQGLIAHAKSSQAMFNYGMTNQATHLALTPRAPWVAALGQIEGLEQVWNDANNRNISVLPYRPVAVDGALVGPPQRQQASAPDAGWINWTQQMTMMLKSTIGMYENNLGMRGQEVSGRAIKAREMQGDNATFHYADNLARAIALTGRILVECIPYYYDTKRIVHIVGEDDTRKAVTINEPQAPGPDGALQAIAKNDVRVGTYAVTVASGPTYATKKEEMADLVVEMAKVDPLLAQSAGDILIKVQDIPEASELAERRKALLPPPVQQLIAAKEQGQNPQMAALAQQMKQMQAQFQQQAQAMQGEMQKLAQENQALKVDKSAQIEVANAKAQEAAAKADSDRSRESMDRKYNDGKLAVERDKVLVDFIKAITPLLTAQMAPQVPVAAEMGTATLEANP